MDNNFHYIHISIHAPAKGATIFGNLCYYNITISIHAPAKGATREICSRFKLTGISIHAPAKGATAALFAVLLGLAISIHAPAKGATHSAKGSRGFTHISIHAPAKGATMADSPMRRIAIFQSTLPRRERQHKSTQAQKHRNFNPRSREGSDAFSAFFADDAVISIHAPAKGATFIC